MLTFFIVITVVVSSINIFNLYGIIWSAEDAAAAILGQSGGGSNDLKNLFTKLTLDQKLLSPEDATYCYVIFEDGKPTEVEMEGMGGSEESVISMAKKVMNKDRKIGFSGKKIGYKIYKNSPKSTTVFFMDCTNALNSAQTFFGLSAVISVISLAIISVILWITSSTMVRPITEAYEKQRRFITDAGHDIKTPITIINSDTELLEMDVGENEWLEDIKKQTSRLTSLTTELIYLSKMEETEKVPHSDFPLSEIAEEVVNSFGSLAITNRVALYSSVTPALFYNGHADSIRKLLNLLLDNAIKYSPEGERVDFVVKKQGRTITIKVSNRAPNLNPKAVEHMFDRFYRSDSSRSSNGGFGIGLSVAKAIVTSHKGRIYASKQKDVLTIDVILF